jgi:TRAP-type C4-dicarboxylate transport system permease small subunit
MKKFLSSMDNDLERWLSLVFYMMIAVTIISEVIRRFVFSYSSIWGEEVARYCFIYMAWLGASLGVKNRAHIRIDIILNFLPNRGKSIVYLFSDFMALILACIALYVSMGSVLTSVEFGSVTHGLRIGHYWFLMAVPFGFTLIVIRLIQSITRDFGDLRTGNKPFAGNSLID